MSAEGKTLSIVPHHEERRGPLSLSDTSSEWSPLEPFDALVVGPNLEDHALRQAARPLRALDWTAIVEEEGHPDYIAVCDVCGSPDHVLSHCGRPLCIPCQRKRVSRYAPVVMDAFQLVLDELDRLTPSHLRRVRPYRLRFITLTLKNVPLGKLGETDLRIQEAYQNLRRRAFWRDCNILGDLPRLEWTYCVSPCMWSPWMDAGGLAYSWHVHLHTVVASAFVPAGPDVARPGESNLRDEWFSLTGDSMVVDVREVDNPREAVSELVKYLFKPTDDAGHSIADWPSDVRREAAEVVAGPYRMGWYCRAHQSRLRMGRDHPTDPTKRRVGCLDRLYETPVGLQPVECTGEYRLERQGFRPLAPTGLFRKCIRRAKVQREARPSDCRFCGLGKLRAKAYWNARIRDSGHSDPWASSALNSIQEHQMTGMPPKRALDLYAEAPAGWHPPPPYEDFRPELRGPTVKIMRSGVSSLDDIRDTLDSHGYRFETSADCHAVDLAIESLRALCIVYGTHGRLYLNESMLRRLTGESA